MTQPAPNWQVAYDFRIDEPYLLKNRLDAMKFRTPYKIPKYKTRWYWLILASLGAKPTIPLTRARVEVERGSYGVPADPDGLSGGFAPILDLLTLPRGPKKMGLGLIYDDSAEYLKKATTYRHIKTRKGEGFTRVTIYRRNA